jgi:putative Ca2+/H+ antiporter (TMEM165/GDT1 family)
MLLFLKVLFTEFIAEMGDKTQLMLVALTSKYKLRDIILGTAAAILVLNGLAVLAGGLVGALIPEWLIKFIAALAFMYFAVTSLKKDDDEEEEASEKKIGFAPLAVFCTFFVAELGDKTQLTAITFGANEGLSSAVIVWLGCSIGLFAADIIGMLIGYLLKSKTPDGILNIMAFVIFAIFGVYTLRQGLLLQLGAESSLLLPILIIAIVAFAGICVWYYLAQRKKAK